VHLWRAELPPALGAAQVRRLAAMLPEEDLARCQRCRQPEARARALASRAALRGVLGACLGMDPREVPLVEGHGKPRLGGSLGGELDFSLSHSGGLALLAVGRGVLVGADVERLRPVPFLDSVVERFFGEAEREELRGLRGGRRRRAYFRLWTRREAAAKALGLGILEHFRRFPRWTAELQEAEGWSVTDLRPAPGYVGAVCREGQGALTGFWVWREREARPWGPPTPASRRPSRTPGTTPPGG
jgi:4'-phosphopantetheinyl transferase